MTFTPNRIVIHYGEIALKGDNQPYFLRQQRKNVKRKLRGMDLSWSVRQAHSYIYITIPPGAEYNPEQVKNGLSQVMGIAWFAFVKFIPTSEAYTASKEPDYEIFHEHLTTLAADTYVLEGSFCVRVNRADKTFPSTSPDLERQFGTALIEQTRWQNVDLENPDRTYHVDIYTDGIYFYAEKISGPGGLPVGVTGRVLVLLSGGIDSPVAAYLAAKRGCTMDFIHFTANRLQMENALEYKVSRIVQDLSRYTYRSRLYLVPYTHFEFEILTPGLEYELVIFRRFMARTAQHLARDTGAQALVTGDNLAQVASQTLENITANSQAVHLPILRPLLTFDKYEIVQLAKQISTYQLSIQPYKDCCSLIGMHPKTKSEHTTLSEIEQSLLPDYDNLITRTMQDALCLTYQNGRLVENG
ncbi:MAG TPA: tRNA uracil 4-sulfurtransferase ThiI [bacterium]|nr:tRNA uracil 4-sulfurtransferase ThiI [bacterium]